MPNLHHPHRGDAVYVTYRLTEKKQPNGVVIRVMYSCETAVVYFLKPAGPGQLFGGDTEEYVFGMFDKVKEVRSGIVWFIDDA